MARSQWGSKLGFILASAGSTIGLGAIWKFPYVTSIHGGGAFLVIYLLICLTLGLSLMVTEIAIGRSTHSSPVGAFRKLRGRAWPLIGFLTTFICFCILSFYSVIGGWTIAYFFKTISGVTHIQNALQNQTNFTDFITHAYAPLLYHFIFAAMTASIIIFGVQKGIERLSKYLMPLLLILLLILISRSLTLDGSLHGLKTFLLIDFSKITGKTFIDALGLSFFSLSLAMGIMVTYGSYLDEKSNIMTSTVWVISLTLFTCILSGLMVLPAVSALQLPANAGPGLTFITMPTVFAYMPFGQLFGAAFFILLLIAALTSSISLLEVIVSFLIDEFKISRSVAATLIFIGFFSLGVVASLSLGVWSDFHILGYNIFDFLDKMTLSVLMPIGEFFLAIFAAWVVWPKIYAQLYNQHNHVLLCTLRYFLGIIVPIVILVILYVGLKEANWL